MRATTTGVAPEDSRGSLFSRLDRRLGTPRARIAGLLFVLLFAGLLRGIFFAQVSETEDFARLAVDAHGYDEQARAVLAGTWPGDEVFYQDALYPYFLAAHYRILGDAPEQVFVTQAVLGVISACLIFLLASLVLGPTEGLVAGLVAASYGTFLFYETLLLKATLSTFMLTTFLIALVLARRRGTLVSALLAGLFLGVCCLLRGNLLVLVPLAALLLLWPSLRDVERGRKASTVVFLLGAALAISPVTIHNVRAGEFVLITSQAGQNFYIGNNPLNESGSYVPPPGVRGVQTYEQIDFARLAENEAGRKLTPTERSDFWFDKAFDWIRAEPRAAATLLWKKLLLFVNHMEVPDNADFGATREEVALLRLPLPTFSVLLALAAAALVLLRPTEELVAIVLAGLAVSTTVVAFYVFSRYRLPVVPMLIIVAAGLPRGIANALRERRHMRLVVALLLACGAAFLTSRDVWTGSRSMLHYNRALFALEDQNEAGALEHLERALGAEADNWYALTLRGQLRAERGEIDLAKRDLREACAFAPGASEPRYKLGLLLEQNGEADGARAAYSEAISVERHDVAAVRLANLEWRAGDGDTAQLRLKEIAARRPRFFPALELLGRVLLDSGDAAGAVQVLERAAEIQPDHTGVARELARARRLADG